MEQHWENQFGSKLKVTQVLGPKHQVVSLDKLINQDDVRTKQHQPKSYQRLMPEARHTFACSMMISRPGPSKHCYAWPFLEMAGYLQIQPFLERKAMSRNDHFFGMERKSYPFQELFKNCPIQTHFLELASPTVQSSFWERKPITRRYQLLICQILLKAMPLLMTVTCRRIIATIKYERVINDQPYVLNSLPPVWHRWHSW